MSQRRDDFLLNSFSERSAMAVRLQLPRKKAPSPTDQHVGARVRMRRKELAMSPLRRRIVMLVQIAGDDD